MIEQKECFKCSKLLPLSDFYRHPDMPDGHVNKCKECNKKDVKKNWWDNIESKRQYDVDRQRYSIQRIANHRYNSIKTRCTNGGAGGRKYFVTGKEYLSQQEFNEWFYEKDNFVKFLEMYTEWVRQDFANRYIPSIDRIDPKLGYLLGNIQWLSKSENCKKYNKTII